jgi:hypothetical protein
MVLFHVEFVKSGRGKAQCPPDPKYPDGVEVRLNTEPGAETCYLTLPYPAPECGMWDVHCGRCGLGVLITAAGRPDDPKAVWLPCDMKEKHA